MDLKELLGEELYNSVMTALGEKAKIAIISDGSYIPKAKFDERGDEIKSLKDQVKERDGQIATLGKATKDNETLQAQIAKMQGDNEAQTKALQEKIEKQAFDHALDRALDKAKAKNPKAARALLDTSKLSLDGENILGLDEQVKALQKSDAYLFGESTPAGGGANPPGAGGTPVKNPYTKEHYNLTEQMKLERTNPALAAQMSAAAGVN